MTSVDKAPALSDSTALAVDCAKYLQVLLVATDMGQHSADLSTDAVAATTGLSKVRQAQVRTALRIAGLMHIEYTDKTEGLCGYRLALGDGR